jgi:hypothetical protein
MSRYKTFGDTRDILTDGLKSFIKKSYTSYPNGNSSHIDKPNPAMMYQNAKDIAYSMVNARKENFSNERTPYQNISMPYSNTQVPYENSQVPYQNTAVSYNDHTPINDILQEPQYHQQPQYQQPMYYEPQRYMEPRYQEHPSEVSGCEALARHLDGCKRCMRKYKTNYNSYLTVIVVMAFIILFLMTKLVDK